MMQSVRTERPTDHSWRQHMDIAGTYQFDPRGTAKIMAGFFRERFTMKDGFDEAVLASFEAGVQDPEIASLRLVIGAEDVTLASSEGSETYPIIERTDTEGAAHLILSMDGERWDFEVVDMGEGSICLYNDAHSFAEYAWRPA